MKRLIGFLGLAKRHLKWMGQLNQPLVASLKLTTHCNLSCPQCPWVKDQWPDLPTEKWCEIIQGLAQRGIVHFVLEGGEPTQRADLQTLIAVARKHGRATVVTNGTASLQPYLPNRFLVSVDGLEDVHDQHRGLGSFRQMMDNLKTTKLPKVALVSLHKQNKHQLPLLLSLLSKIFDGIWFGFVYDYQKRPSLELSREEKQALARCILKDYRHYPVVNTRTFLKSVGTARKCRPYLLTTILANGREHAGCQAATFGPSDCDRCDLPCHRELSLIAEPFSYLDQLRTLARKPWLWR